MNFENLTRLAEKAKKGDTSALTELYNETNQSMYFYTLNVVGNEQDAMDVMQNSYVRMITKINTLKKPEMFYAWMKQIVYNECIRLRKKNNTYVPDSDEGKLANIPEENSEFLPEEMLHSKEKQTILLREIDKLSDNQKQALLLFYYDGLKIQEIAHITGSNENTVKFRLHEARNKLKRSLLPLVGQGAFGVAPVPVLTRVFQTASMQAQISAKLSAALLENLNRVLPIAVRIGTIKAAATATAVKILAPVCGVVVIAGASIAIAANFNGDTSVQTVTPQAVSPTAVAQAAIQLEEMNKPTETPAIEESEPEPEPVPEEPSVPAEPAPEPQETTSESEVVVPAQPSGIESILNSAPLNPMRTNDAELDALVENICSQIFTPGMTTYDKVKACYDYLINNCSYGHNGIYYFGYDYDGANINRAYALLTTNIGVCDDYSSAFMVMTRYIGLDSYYVGGETAMSAGGWGGHAWVNIRINGTYYIFDPQVEDNIAGGNISYLRFCKTDAELSTKYQYNDREGYIAQFNNFQSNG